MRAISTLVQLPASGHAPQVPLDASEQAASIAPPMLRLLPRQEQGPQRRQEVLKGSPVRVPKPARASCSADRLTGDVVGIRERFASFSLVKNKHRCKLGLSSRMGSDTALVVMPRRKWTRSGYWRSLYPLEYLAWSIVPPRCLDSCFGHE